MLGGPAATSSYVLAHLSIDFRREVVLADEAVVVRCRSERLGRSSLRTCEHIVTAAGELAAEAEAVLVARDPQTGRSRPFSPQERSAFDRDVAGRDD